MAGTLHDELLSIPGIANAEFDGDVGSPEGVRVRLALDADADEVSREVQRVLAAHGMRSQLALSAVASSQEPPPPPGAPDDAAVVVLPGVGRGSTSPSAESSFFVQPDEVAEPPDDRDASATSARSLPDQQPATLESVAVEEGRQGVRVRVTTSAGASAVREAAPMAGGMDEAVANAVAELVAPGTARLVGIHESVVEGSTVLTVVVELGDRSRRAGAALLEGGRAFEIARATWAAFTSQD